MNQMKLNPMAEAMGWVSKITTCSLTMIIPGISGVWLDSQIHTAPAFCVIGFLIGMASGGYLLLRMVNNDSHS